MPNFASIKFLTIAATIAYLALQATCFAQSESINAYLTGKETDGIPRHQAQTQFDCSEKVHLVLEMSGLEEGKHQLQVKWFDPRNKLEETTRYPFQYLDGGTRIWAWLRLSGPPGAAIGRVFDPSFGMGAFIGNWRAEVTIDDKVIQTLDFSVLC